MAGLLVPMNVWGDIWSAIVAGLNWLLQGLFHLTGSYGIAIILITLIVKFVLLPLTIRQTRSMIAMQKIQPEIRKLQEKYKDDKEKLSQEMMKFYKENKVNPFGGCLPLILQLPVFFALFTVLRKYLLTAPIMQLGNTFTILKNFPGIVYIKNSGFLWIHSLADTTRTADPTFILLILLAASTWYSQKQVMTDPRQRNMMIIMPLVTAFIGLSLPAGVTLYWITTNVLQIIQQWGMAYYDKKHPREEPRIIEEKKPSKQPAKAVGARGKHPAQRTGPPPGAKGGKGEAVPRGRPPAKPPGGAKPGGAKPKPKAASQKGKQPAKTKGGPAKGGAKSQARKPKSPPPAKKAGKKPPPKGGGKRKK
jgi:YidC/Oxa1 family membrane protein insertase